MAKENRKCRYLLNTPRLLRDRELGFKRKLGYDDEMTRKIYANMNTSESSIPVRSHMTKEGGIFNLEFSLDG